MIREMILKKLDLENFRNYEKREFVFGDRINLILGNNGAGKTNLLEAIYLISVGESFRKGRIEEMVKFGNEMGRVVGKIGEDEEKLEVIVSNGVVQGKKTLKRLFRFDGALKKRVDFVGNLAVVVFRPEDLEFVSGSPSYRRNSVDRVLVQVNREYAHSLVTYEQTIRRRNKLLFLIREGRSNRAGLAFWNGLLVKHGRILTEMRSKWVEFVNNLWKRSELFNYLKMEYKKNIVSEERMEEKIEIEIAMGMSLVGPHKDDFALESSVFGLQQNSDLGIYGSRGEQRMGVLALKMGELYFIEKSLDIKPILLLDDIFSELDSKHRDEVIRVMQGRQVVVTTAEKEGAQLDGKIINI